MKNITIIITSFILFFASSLKAQEIVSTPTLTPKTDSLPKKVKEFGIGFSSLTAYSLQYRWGNTKRLFRINATITGSTAFGSGTSGSNQTNVGNGNNMDSTTNKTKTPLNFSTSLSFSILNLKYIAKKFGLMYGPVAGVGYSIINSQSTQTGINSTNYTYNSSQNNGNFPISSSTKTESVTFQPYLGFVLGAFYKINKSFFIYAEIAPNIYYARTNSTSSTTNTNNSQSNYSYGNNSSTFNNTFGIASLSNSAATITIVYRITKPNRKITAP